MTEAPPVVPDHEVYPRVIAKGAYGQVHLARNVMGTWRAVKVICRSNFESERPYEREFQAIRRFEPASRSHPSQVAILQVGRDDVAGFFYYVMELADDASRGLDERSPPNQASASDPHPALREIDAENETGVSDPSSYVPHTLALELKRRGRLALEECLSIGLSLATALDHLHRHELVHRDVKPANIVFVNGMAKLADIGLVAGAGARTMVGTEGYIPPEGPGEPPADIFGLGKVIYEMMTGLDRTEFPKLPSDFADWENHDRWLELNNVVLKAAANDTARRYPIAAQLHADLLNVQAGESPRWQRAQRMMKALKVALGTVAVVSLAALAFLVHLNSVAREARRGVLIRDAKMIRLGERLDGQSGHALEKLRQAGQTRVDNDLRSEVVATLIRGDPRFTSVATNTATLHMAFDAQGGLLLSDGGGRGAARIWDYRCGQTTILASTNVGPVWFDARQKPLQFTSLGNGAFAIVAPDRGTILRELRVDGHDHGSPGQVETMAISRGGGFCGAAISMGGESLVAVWETGTGQRLASIAVSCSALAISPSGDCLATGDTGGHVWVWSLPDMQPIASFQQNRGSILCLTFHEDLSQPTGQASQYPWLLAAGDGGGKIHIYQVRPGKLRATCLGSPFRVSALAFSADGMTLASGGHREVRIWDVGTGRLAATLISDNVTSLAFSSDGTLLAVNRHRDQGPGDDPAVCIATVASHVGATALRGLSSETVRLAFSLNGEHLAALSHNWEVAIWNTTSNKLRRVLEVPKGGSVDNAAIAFGRDDRQFAFATSKHAGLWDIDTGMVIRSWTLPAGLNQWLWFTDQGELLHFQWEWNRSRSAGICRTRVLLLQGDTKPVAEFVPLFSGGIRRSALSGDGRLVAVAGVQTDPARSDRKVTVYETMTGNRLDLPFFPDDVECFSFAPSGSLFAFLDIPTAATAIRLLTDGKELGRHVGAFLALGPGGRWFVRSDCVLVDSGTPSRALTLGLDWNPRLCAFSPDGRWLGLGTAEGTVLVYELRKVAQQLGEHGVGW